MTTPLLGKQTRKMGKFFAGNRLKLERVSPDDMGRLREPPTSVCIAIAIRLYLFNIAANKII
jgi:hypothetical protein